MIRLLRFRNANGLDLKSPAIRASYMLDVSFIAPRVLSSSVSYVSLCYYLIVLIFIVLFVLMFAALFSCCRPSCSLFCFVFLQFFVFFLFSFVVL